MKVMCPRCERPFTRFHALIQLFLDGDRHLALCDGCGKRYLITAHVTRRFTTRPYDDDADMGD